MAWEAIAAAGSIAGAIILLGGTIAAVIQLKHLRLTYQIESYLSVMGDLNSPDLVRARQLVESHDFNDASVMPLAYKDGVLDPDVARLGGFLQSTARLINQGIADPRLFAPFIIYSVGVWKGLRLVALEIRRRTGVLRWFDVDVLVYNTQFMLHARRLSPGYPAHFIEPLEEFLRTLRDEARAMSESA